MMFMFTALLAITATAASLELEESCEPGTTFNDYCNTCRCGTDGKSRACTLMYCDPALWNKDGTLRSEVTEAWTTTRATIGEEFEIATNFVCNETKTFDYYCNTCECNAEGAFPMCTMMLCDTNVWNEDGTLKSDVEIDTTEPPQQETEQICEPHATYQEYCNTCTCGADGKDSICTLMACDPSVWNKDGSLKIA